MKILLRVIISALIGMVPALLMFFLAVIAVGPDVGQWNDSFRSFLAFAMGFTLFTIAGTVMSSIR